MQEQIDKIEQRLNSQGQELGLFQHNQLQKWNVLEGRIKLLEGNIQSLRIWVEGKAKEPTPALEALRNQAVKVSEKLVWIVGVLSMLEKELADLKKAPKPGLLKRWRL